MHSSLLITLLSLAMVLVTLAEDFYCDTDTAAENVTTDHLIASKWQVVSNNDQSHVSECISFQFNQSSKGDNDLVLTTYVEDKEERSVFMQYVGPGKFILWNTGDLGFNPSQPGNVAAIGQAIFTKFFTIPFANASAFEFYTCYLYRDDTGWGSEASNEVVGVTWYLAISGNRLTNSEFIEVRSTLNNGRLGRVVKNQNICAAQSNIS